LRREQLNGFSKGGEHPFCDILVGVGSIPGREVASFIIHTAEKLPERLRINAHKAGLLNAENCDRFCLCEAATLDDAVDLPSEMGHELLAFGIGETKIGKHVTAAFFEASGLFSRHCQLLLCRLSR